MSQVPAATRTLRVLRFLASQPDPVPLDRDHARVRPAAQHGVPPARAMVDEGFVVHLADEHRYGLGVAAFEVGSGYSRQEPLQRIARRPLADARRPGPARARTSRCCTAATSSTSSRSAPPAGRRWSPTSASGCPPT